MNASLNEPKDRFIASKDEMGNARYAQVGESPLNCAQGVTATLYLLRGKIIALYGFAFRVF